eukprot:1499152-Pyramimonas_sp.AAC.1
MFSGTAQMSRENMLNEILKEAKGSSGATCKGMIGYLGKHGPPVHIWENVPEILDPTNADNLEWLLSALNKLNYACEQAKFVSTDFGIPQRRRPQN